MTARFLTPAAVTCGIVAVAVAMTTGTALGARATAASGPTLISSAGKGKLGRVLTNNAGQTLYLFTRDPSGRSECSGNCTNTWVPLVGGAAAAKKGAGLNSRLVGTIVRSGGARQVTYNHHPLYRYVGDKTTKTTNGEGANEDGGYWYVVNTSGNEVKPKSSGACHPVCSGY